MALNLRPLHDLVGVEVKGIDLRLPIDEQTGQELIAAFRKHYVLLVRDQKLEQADQERYSSIFGDITYRGGYAPDGSPRTSQFISNTREDGILSNGELYFHQDQTFFDPIMVACTLYGIEIPAQGGDTLFADSAALYESLPADYQAKLDGLKALHVFDYGRDPNKRMEESEISQDAPRCVHPVIWHNPHTGRKHVWMNPVSVHHIQDMDSDESDEIVADLSARINDTKFYYRHQWRVGDIVIWDNQSVQHMRENFDPSQPRTLRRMPLLGKADAAVGLH